jgi:hypothetical protein
MVQGASRWAEGDIVKWDVDGIAAFGKITRINKDATDAAKITAVVDVYTQEEGPYAASGKTQTVPLAALSKPMTQWNKVWMLASGAGLAIMVLFALLFRYKREAKPAPDAS